MIKTIIFDLDDTLYDEIDYCRNGLQAVAEFLASKYSCCSDEIIFKTLWECFKTSDRTKVFNKALEKLGISYNDILIKKLVKVSHNHKPDIKLPVETKKVLDKLSASYKLALITDGFLPAQKLKVKALGIKKYFRTIVYTEELGRKN